MSPRTFFKLCFFSILGASAVCSASEPLLKSGLSQAASDELRSIGIKTSQIMQTIGNAKASAGTHAQDGKDSMGHAYSAATDLSVRTPVRLTATQIKFLLERLARHGFAAYYRKPGTDHWPAKEAEHIHAVFVGEPMKLSLREQVQDWLHGRNGLASHATYLFWQPSGVDEDLIRTRFNQFNR